MWSLVRLPLIDMWECTHINIQQLLAKVRNTDEDAVAPVGPVLQFPHGALHQSYPENHIFVLFLSPPEAKALHFIPLQGDLAVSSLSIACPEAKGNTHFSAHCLVPVAVLPCWADLASVSFEVASGTAWCMLLSHQASTGSETALAPSEHDFKRSSVSSHDAGSDSG